MKIFAINGSPHGPDGNTDILLQTYLAGAAEAGAQAETVYLRDKQVEPCRGCFSCWIGGHGVCVHQDDMADLIERLRAADLVVFAMPLYIYSVPGLMKDFLDRLLPFADPAIVRCGEQYVHPERWENGISKCVIVSNAGFPEVHHFEPLHAMFEHLLAGPQRGIVGTIYCAGGPMLRLPGADSMVRPYLEAAWRAGRETVTLGCFSEETQATLDRPLCPSPEAYAAGVNAHWKAAGVVLPEGAPLPSSRTAD